MPSTQDANSTQITIYHGGDILTMESDNPTAEAVAVQNGNILSVGSLQSMKNISSTKVRYIDLHRKTLIPAFFDPHTHIFCVAMSFSTANLRSPPIGTVDSIDKLLDTLRQFITDRKIGPDHWVVGNGYDENGMIECRHPTRSDLDKVSKDIPIFILQASMHCAVANSAALKRGAIGESTPNPAGGTIHREKESNVPNGVLEEAPAFIDLFHQIPPEDYGMNEECFKKALNAYASHGSLTAQEPGGDVHSCLRVLSKMSREQPTDVAAVDTMLFGRVDYAKFLTENSDFAGREYKNHVRLAGVKMLLDGSIQGYTAHLTQPYHKPPPGQERGWAGYPTYRNQTDVDAIVEECFRNRWQVLAHANGDAAAGQLISAVRRALKVLPQHLTHDHRTTIIHGQTLRDDQLDEIAQLGIFVSFFPNHTFYWGDLHITKFLGKDRAFRMNPIRNAIKRGIPYTIHNDATVTPMSIIDVIYFACNRFTQSGVHMGPEQEISVEEALRGVTINGAMQHFEENRKGSIKVGKNADFVVLSANLLKIDKKKLREVEVLETIKNGTPVFKKETKPISRI